MQEAFIRILSAHRAQIRTRWEALLRIERVNTPLANPDTLVYLFDQTLDEVFRMLRHPPVRHVPAALEQAGGQNPLIAYFIAGEQALLEALVLDQVAARDLDPAERDTDAADLKSIMRTIARRDIGSLEGLSLAKKSAVTAGKA